MERKKEKINEEKNKERKKINNKHDRMSKRTKMKRMNTKSEN